MYEEESILLVVSLDKIERASTMERGASKSFSCNAFPNNLCI